MNFRATGTTAYLILEGKEREFINRCRKTKSDGKPIPKQIRAKKKTLACSNSPSIGPWSMGKSLEPSNSIKRPVPGDFTKQTKCKVVSSSSSGTLIISRTKNKRPNEVKTKNKKQAKKKRDNGWDELILTLDCPRCAILWWTSPSSWSSSVILARSSGVFPWNRSIKDFKGPGAWCYEKQDCFAKPTGMSTLEHHHFSHSSDRAACQVSLADHIIKRDEPIGRSVLFDRACKRPIVPHALLIVCLLVIQRNPYWKEVENAQKKSNQHRQNQVTPLAGDEDRDSTW